MEQIVFQIGRILVWLLPLTWLGLAGWSLNSGARSAGLLFGIAGILLLARNTMFLYVLSRPADHNNFVYFFVQFDEAPIGFLLSYLLPFIYNLSLVAACVTLVVRRV